LEATNWTKSAGSRAQQSDTQAQRREKQIGWRWHAKSAAVKGDGEFDGGDGGMRAEDAFGAIGGVFVSLLLHQGLIGRSRDFP
jgi:hypothetical protein